MQLVGVFYCLLQKCIWLIMQEGNLLKERSFRSLQNFYESLRIVGIQGYMVRKIVLNFIIKWIFLEYYCFYIRFGCYSLYFRVIFWILDTFIMMVVIVVLGLYVFLLQLLLEMFFGVQDFLILVFDFRFKVNVCVQVWSLYFFFRELGK